MLFAFLLGKRETDLLTVAFGSFIYVFYEGFQIKSLFITHNGILLRRTIDMPF